jgi:hypothetical protein
MEMFDMEMFDMEMFDKVKKESAPTLLFYILTFYFLIW